MSDGGMCGVCGEWMADLKYARKIAVEKIVAALWAAQCTNSPQKIAEIAADALFGKVEK